jgi:hypothetical protein
LGFFGPREKNFKKTPDPPSKIQNSSDLGHFKLKMARKYKHFFFNIKKYGTGGQSVSQNGLSPKIPLNE